MVYHVTCRTASQSPEQGGVLAAYRLIAPAGQSEPAAQYRSTIEMNCSFRCQFFIRNISVGGRATFKKSPSHAEAAISDFAALAAPSVKTTNRQRHRFRHDCAGSALLHRAVGASVAGTYRGDSADYYQGNGA
jgi:hypothetical protein